MKNKKLILSIIAGLVIAGGIIAWLMLSGDKPVTIKPGDGVSAQINASLKNSVVKREKDGKPLWEFTVEEVVNDKAKNEAYLKGIKGKLYRNDGSYLEMTADKGSAGLKSNDFALEGNIKAVLNTGGELYADKITWNQAEDVIKAVGNFRLHKDSYTATADSAETTSAFKHVKLKGKAKVEKGGE